MPKEKVQKDKQGSTKHTHTTKDQVTQTSLWNVVKIQHSSIYWF